MGFGPEGMVNIFKVMIESLIYNVETLTGIRITNDVIFKTKVSEFITFRFK